jgi:negative regulator of flagellin synthesis FlgM
VKGVSNMIISNKQVHQVLESFGKRKPTKENNNNQKTHSLSDKTSKPVEEAARKVIGSSPEVREDRVKELRESICNDQYDRTGKEIADKMISRSLVDSILGETTNMDTEAKK